MNVINAVIGLHPTRTDTAVKKQTKKTTHTHKQTKLTAYWCLVNHISFSKKSSEVHADKIPFLSVRL